MLLSLQEISHHFGALQVLDSVNFSVAAGEVHALLGENGAGKTTLMQVAYGLIRPADGEIVVGVGAENQRFPKGFKSPAEARSVGIGMVHQHFTSIAAFTVSENIALAGGWPETGRAAEQRARALIAEVGLPVDPSAQAGHLSVGQRQRLEILKALAAETRILLLDEPTAVLAPREVAELQRSVMAFRERGGAVVLITHKLPEVFGMADRVTVLRRGRVVLSSTVPAESTHSLARAMLGEERESSGGKQIASSSIEAAEILVAADHLSLAREHISGDPGESIHDATFMCRAGEITGVAAIEGNGQRELLRTIAGVESVRQLSGTLNVKGPIAFIPDDRLAEAIIPSFTLTENVLLGTLGDGTWVDWNSARARTSELIENFDVRAQSADDLASSLSGGNQQKLVFGRAMLQSPRILVAEQPTRGLDLRATADIHQRLRDAAAQGMAVIVYAADLDEIIGLADRLLVIANGNVREFSIAVSRDEIGDAMLGIGHTV